MLALDCIAIESCQNYGALTHLECSRQSRMGIRHVLSQTKTTSAAQTHSIELPCAIFVAGFSDVFVPEPGSTATLCQRRFVSIQI